MRRSTHPEVTRLERRLAPAVILVTTTADSGPGSLRAALDQANAQPGPDEIEFAATLGATITLASPLAVTDAVTLRGPGPDRLTLAGAGSHRLIEFATPGVQESRVSGLTLTGGFAVQGGAIRLDNDSLTLDQCLLEGNAAAIQGGAISLGGGHLTVRNSTLNANSAPRGGAIHADPGGSLRLENSTLSGNSAAAFGGAVYTVVGTAVSVRSSTVTGNAASDGAGLFFYLPAPDEVRIVSSVISGNSATSAPDLRSLSVHPLVLEASAVGNGSGFLWTGSGNLPFGANLKLAPLEANGGPTRTHALRPGSPAINAGAVVPGVTLDQRGRPRADGQPDIGAFELQPAPRVAQVVVNDGAAQRSRVTRLRVEFDAPVVFDGPPADAFTLNRVADGLAIGLTSGPASPTSVELTFAGPGLDAGSLPDGRFTLTLFAASLLGDGLDGNGDGTGGDDFVLVGSPTNGLFRLFGDANGNGHVDASDSRAFRLAFLTADPTFDADGNGQVAPADFLRFRARYLAEV